MRNLVFGIVACAVLLLSAATASAGHPGCYGGGYGYGGYGGYGYGYRSSYYSGGFAPRVYSYGYGAPGLYPSRFGAYYGGYPGGYGPGYYGGAYYGGPRIVVGFGGFQ